MDEQQSSTADSVQLSILNRCRGGICWSTGRRVVTSLHFLIIKNVVRSAVSRSVVVVAVAEGEGLEEARAAEEGYFLIFRDADVIKRRGNFSIGATNVSPGTTAVAADGL